MKYLLLFSLTFLSLQLHAQDTIQYQPPVAEEKPDLIYEFTDVLPSFPGEKNSYEKFVKENLKYPKSLKRQHKEGTVYVEILVLKDGSVTNAKVRRDIGEESAEAALELISKMPKWNPATQKGKAVAFRLTIPIRFIL